mmetsp:Transcript_23683/g.66884  ORF Transcript_23683/g.66884 Transcript_23683/m.66884 type:complete len:564 (+) Transcript_23683:115-1806(+)
MNVTRFHPPTIIFILNEIKSVESRQIVVDVLDAAELNAFTRRWIRMDVAADGVESQIVLDCQRDLVDHFSGTLGDDGSTENFLGALGHDRLAESNTESFGDGPVVVFQSGSVDVDFDSLLGGYFFRGDPDGCVFRVGVRHGGHHQAAEFPVISGKRVLDDQLCHFAAHVSEARDASDAIADSVHVGVGDGLGQIVHGNAFACFECHVGLVQPDIFHIGHPARGDKQAFALDDFVADGELHEREIVRRRSIIAATFDGLHLRSRRAAQEFDAILFQQRLQQFACFLVTALGLEQSRRSVQHCDLRTQEGEGLRHLQSDHTGSHNHDSWRQRLQIEELFVGGVRRLLQSWDVGDGWPAAGCHDALLELQFLAVDFHSVGTCEPSATLEDVSSGALCPTVPIRRCDLRPDFTKAPHDGTEINLDLTLWNDDSKLGRVSHFRNRTGGTNESLGWDAANVQAVTACEVFRYHGALGATSGGLLGADEPTGASSDRDQIVLLMRLSLIFKVPRMHFIQEHGVVLIQWPHPQFLLCFGRQFGITGLPWLRFQRHVAVDCVRISRTGITLG